MTTTPFDEETWNAAVQAARETAVPAAQEIRPLTTIEAAGLLASIGLSGILQPVLVDGDGAIVDGVHRTAAAAVLGIDVPTTTLDPDEDPERVAVELNAKRRHMSAYQLGAAAHRHAEKTGTKLADSAELWAVPMRTAKRARRLLKSGNLDLIASVENGDKSLGEADMVLTQEADRERWRREDAERAKKRVPLLVHHDTALVDAGDRPNYLNVGVDREVLISSVVHALRNGADRLTIFDKHTGLGQDQQIVAWTAPASASEYEYSYNTIHAVNCIDAWKEALPEWRVHEPTVRVTKAAAGYLGIDPADLPASQVKEAIDEWAAPRLAEAEGGGEVATVPTALRRLNADVNAKLGIEPDDADAAE